MKIVTIEDGSIIIKDGQGNDCYIYCELSFNQDSRTGIDLNSSTARVADKEAFFEWIETLESSLRGEIFELAFNGIIVTPEDWSFDLYIKI